MRSLEYLAKRFRECLSYGMDAGEAAATLEKMGYSAAETLAARRLVDEREEH